MLVFGQEAFLTGKWLKRVLSRKYSMAIQELDLLMDPTDLMIWLLQPILHYQEADPEWLQRSADEYSDCAERFSFLRGRSATPRMRMLYHIYTTRLGIATVDAVLHASYIRMVQRIFMLFSSCQTRSKYAALRTLILTDHMETTKLLDQLVEYTITYPRTEIILTTVTFLSLNTLQELIPRNRMELRGNAPAA